jgi:hypothetical protein
MKRLFLTLFVILTAISAGYSSVETHYVHNCHCGSITVDGLALMLQIPVSGDARTHLTGEPVAGDDMVMGLAYTVSAFFPPAKISKGVQIATKGTQIVSKVGMKTITQFSNRTIDDAVNLVMKDANKLDHLFPAKHNLDGLVNQLGGRENTIRAILNVANGKLPASGVFNNIPVTVGGQTVIIRGNVINGVPRLGTIYIP